MENHKELFQNEDFFLVLGKISIYFSTLDFMTSELIHRLEIKDGTKLKKKLNTLGQKFELLNRLNEVDVINTDILREIKLFINGAISIAQKRNRFIHDNWVFNEAMISKGLIIRYELSQEYLTNPNGKKYEHTFNEFVQLLEDIGDVQVKVLLLLNKYKLKK